MIQSWWFPETRAQHKWTNTDQGICHVEELLNFEQTNVTPENVMYTLKHFWCHMFWLFSESTQCVPRDWTICSHLYSFFTAPQRNRSSLDLINSAWGWPESRPPGLCVCVCADICVQEKKKLSKGDVRSIRRQYFLILLPVIHGEKTEKNTYGKQASCGIGAAVCAAGLSRGVKGLAGWCGWAVL